MNLFPLIIAVAAVMLGAGINYIWPGMEVGYKKLLYILVVVAVVICLIAVFWPLFAGHMTVGK